MGKPSAGFKAGKHPEYCVYCGGKWKAGKHTKDCPLGDALQDLQARKLYCPLCGEEVVGDHVC